jgi:hypothetical protein
MVPLCNGNRSVGSIGWRFSLQSHNVESTSESGHFAFMVDSTWAGSVLDGHTEKMEPSINRPHLFHVRAVDILSHHLFNSKSWN